jgi:hypothetical protein
MLWNVQMNRRQKASIIGILGLGLFATAAALVKLSYVSTYGRSGDWLWDSRNLTIWTCIECNIAIVAGNLPCLKPLFRTILGSTYGRGSRKTDPSKYVSRPYGTGTNHRSDNKAYSELHSNKGADGKYQGYKGGRDAYMLTTIGTDKQTGGDVSRLSSGRTSPAAGKSSTESVAHLNDKTLGGLRGIAVTTKVDVSESIHSPEIEVYEGGKQRPTLKEMV